MKDDSVYLQHMVDSIATIEDPISDVTEEEFHEETLLQDGVIRRLEIIGEAAKLISSETQDRYDDIPWQDIAGMRDRLIHGYFGVDLDIVWETLEKDIPQLKQQLQQIQN